MANQSVWYQTFLDEDVINTLGNQINEGKSNFEKGKTGAGGVGEVNIDIRDSKISWLGTHHWIGPLIWYYIERANRENFRFDINSFDGESFQYTTYGPGQYYGWHRDDSPASKAMWVPAQMGQERPDWADLTRGEACRKLSFSLLLTDKSEYEGGQFQMMSYDNKMYEVPQEKGILLIFDSTTLHRVRPVKSGTRKSLVGWILGPRWR